MRILILFLFVLGGITSSQAQIFGGRLGYGFNNLQFDTLTIQNQSQVDTFSISLENQGRIIYAGVFFRLPMGPFYLEAEPMLSSYEYPVRIRNLQGWNGGSVLKTERFSSADLGLSAGVKLWKFLRFQGGIRTQIWVNYDSNVSTFTPEYSNDWSKYVNSYQAGIGLDIVNMTLDFGYEKTLNGIGDNITFFGNNYALNATRERFTLKLGVRIISYEED